MTTEETMRDAFAQALTCTYVCGRVWEAWSVGTMTQDDFSPAGECDEVLDSLAAPALAALTLVQAERDAMQQERDELRAALGELVSCKALKEQESRLRNRRECSILRTPNSLARVNAMRDDYNRRKPLAWAAAEGLLAPKATQEPKA